MPPKVGTEISPFAGASGSCNATPTKPKLSAARSISGEGTREGMGGLVGDSLAGIRQS